MLQSSSEMWKCVSEYAEAGACQGGVVDADAAAVGELKGGARNGEGGVRRQPPVQPHHAVHPGELADEAGDAGRPRAPPLWAHPHTLSFVFVENFPLVTFHFNP